MVPPTLEQRPRFGFMHRLATLLLGKSGATVRLASSDPALLIDVRMLRARSGGGRITSQLPYSAISDEHAREKAFESLRVPVLTGSQKPRRGYRRVGHADTRPSPCPIRLRTAPKPMANLAPGAPRYGAGRRRKNATWLRYQISPRAFASGDRLRYLRLDRATLHGIGSLAHSNEL